MSSTSGASSRSAALERSSGARPSLLWREASCGSRMTERTPSMRSKADTRKRIARIRVARNPIAIDATDDAVWVAHAGGEIVRIDARRRSAGEPFEAGGSLTGVAANGSRVWATDLATNSLIELDARTSRRRRVYRIGAGTVRVAVAGDYLWVTNRESSVIRVDPARTRSVLSRTSGSAPSG